MNRDVRLTVPSYTPACGVRLEWMDGFTIAVSHDHGETVIRANREGLLSLANHLANLAQNECPPGTHVHLDDSNSLEDGSCGLVLVRD
jgi:hypothetical protein